MRTLKQLALGSLATGALLLGSFAGAPGAQAAPSCQFSLGFAAIDALIPTTVGTCLENEGHNPVNGDGLQQTTGGLLVWRKLDNWTAFTNGFHSWINGPCGLQERPNTQRFGWEANPESLPPAGGVVATAMARISANPQVAAVTAMARISANPQVAAVTAVASRSPPPGRNPSPRSTRPSAASSSSSRCN